MTGKYHLEFENKRLCYQLDIERKVTVIKGNSGTGKTTMLELIEEHLGYSGKSGLKVKNDRNVQLFLLQILTSWEYELQRLHGCIIFVDESVEYIYSTDFQKAAAQSDNYFVIISRSGKFNQLPYSINGIYQLCTSQNERQSITKMYNMYKLQSEIQKMDVVITEDSKFCGSNCFST